MLYPTVNVIETGRAMTDRFGGYNHRDRIADGEFYMTENLTSDLYPLAASRRRRSVSAKLTNPQGLMAKDALVYADGDGLYYNGNKIEGVTLSTLSENNPKRLVSMGAYICVFPDKIYVNTADLTEYGSMENSFSSTGNVSFTICDAEAAEYSVDYTSSSEPSSPENGEYWLDTSGDSHILKRYSQTSAMWVEIPTVYVKIEAAGIGTGFKQYDGVTISGISEEDEQLKSLNGSKILYQAADNYIVIVGMLDEAKTVTDTVKVERKVPEMDFVTECQNRLWGCYYGIRDGETVNEIFCCKLGDFKNWECYMGISTDSYRASVGTDGVWTGAVTYLGYPMFFKENFLHKVYVSATGAHQITSTALDGVQKGSADSLAIVADTLIYKTRTGIARFDGSMPVPISDAFGGEMYENARAGRLGYKYYVSMRDGDSLWNLFAYDIRKGIWCREDDTEVKFFADMGDDLYFIDSGNNLVSVSGNGGEKEKTVDWSFTLGTYGYEYAENKYISRFKLRMSLEEGGWAKMLIEYDSDGIWLDSGTVRGTGVNRTFLIPIIPRRCDHMRIRLEGSGEFRLYSIARIIERGSDG